MNIAFLRRTISGVCLLLLSACSDGSGQGGSSVPETFTVGGSVSGLGAGQSLVLGLGGGDTVKVAADGAYMFDTRLPQDGSYVVTIGTQPTGETCSLTHASGAGMTANVTNVNVTCSATTYAISGFATGLIAGQQLTLANGSDTVVVASNGAFSFPTPVNEGGSYDVVVSSPASNETCTVGGGSGAGVDADVNSIAVTCSSGHYTIGGTISGLSAGQQVTLRDNGTDSLTITADGAFTFATPVAFEAGYMVTVATQPAQETCSIAAGSGSGAGVNSNVNAVALVCATNTYPIGGTVTGLLAGQTLTLVDNGGNGGDASTIQGTGSALDFSFANKVAYLGSYAVTVGTQPVGQFCSVTAGSGANVGSAISGVAVNCVRAWYVSGTGVDSHDGKTAATAFRTLGRAAAFVGPGDVVLAMNGTYTNDSGGAVLSLNMAGTADAWITYRAYPGHSPLIQTDGIWGGITFGASARYVEVNGFTVTGNNASLTLAGAQAVQTDPAANPKYNGNCIAAQANQAKGIYPQHLHILNNTVSQCPGGGIATVGADYVTISGNTVYDTALYSAYGCSGISTLNDYDSNPSDKSTPYKMIITNNVVHGNQELIPWLSAGYISDGEGIIIDSNHNHDYVPTVAFPAYTGRTLIANNVVYANGSAAIEVFQSSHVDVVNNSTFGDVTTPSGPSAALAKVTGRGEMNLGQISDVNVFNNIFYSLGDQNPIAQYSACSDCNVDYNIYYGGANAWGKFGANGPHDKVVDPLYVNAATSNPALTSLRLRAGSPAIGAGTSHLAPATDIDGNPRPSAAGFAIGAYAQ